MPSDESDGEALQPLDHELDHYRMGVVDLYLHDWAEGRSLYTSDGKVHTAAAAAEHDGPAIHDGGFCRFEQDGTIVKYHPHAGYLAAYRPKETFDEPIILLKEVQHVA